MSKRPGEQGQGGGPAKRPFESAPEFLDDGEEYEDEDVFLDDAVDGQAAAQAGLGAGVRPNWRRPPPPQLDPAQHSLGACGVRNGRRLRLSGRHTEFQQMDLDYVVGAPLPHMTSSPRQVAIIRLFGVTTAGARARSSPCVAQRQPRRVLAGNSVCCHVHGFQPYFYAAMPASLSPDDVETFRKVLNVRPRRARVQRTLSPLSRQPRCAGPNWRGDERAAAPARLRPAGGGCAEADALELPGEPRRARSTAERTDADYSARSRAPSSRSPSRCPTW